MAFKLQCHTALSLSVELKDEAGAANVLGIDVEVAIHLQRHLLADRQAKTVAGGEVAHFEEGLEDVVALLFRDAAAGV